MKKNKSIFRPLAALLMALTLVLTGTVLAIQSGIPDKFLVAEGESFSIHSRSYIDAVVTKSRSFATGAYASAGNSYRMDLKLLGIIQLKEVNVEVVPASQVVVSGAPFGIKMFTEGVMVVGLSDIPTAGTTVNPARDAGIKVGDIIEKIDGKQVTSNEDTAQIISLSEGRPLTVELIRKGERLTASLRAVQSEDGGWRAGIWVRDSSAGVGTMTFYNPATNTFAGLGHAVCDVDTGEILPLMSGEIVPVLINGVVKSQSGTPGELRGTFTSTNAIGQLKINSETGVYGTMLQPPADGITAPLAMKQEICEGPATILTTLSGDTPKEYQIVIEKISLQDSNPTKNMVVRVTDPELLETAGGIVQGMSGSPILQNGKLVGAVTHVFVNQPTRGYAIFAENMLKTAETVK